MKGTVMNLENLGWMLFAKSVQQMGTIKGHLMGSCREFLLALTASLDILKGTTSTLPFFNDNPSLATVMLRIDDVLKFALEELNKRAPTPTDNAMESRLKKQVMDSIIEIIDEEISNLKDLKTKNTTLKRQALESIKSAFLSHQS